MRWIAALALVAVSAIAASATPLFPVPTAGSYSSGIRAAAVELDPDGVPIGPATASVGLMLDDGSLVVCQALGPGETVRVSYTVRNAGVRERARAYAFTSTDCTAGAGMSPASVNAAYYYFGPPPAPQLLD